MSDRLEFGTFLLLQTPSNEPSDVVYRCGVEIAQAADELGFRSTWLAEHQARLPALRVRALRARPRREPAPPAETRVLPMQLKVGDRLVDETREWEVTVRPYTSPGGKNVHARVRRVDRPATAEARTWGVA